MIASGGNSDMPGSDLLQQLYINDGKEILKGVG